MPELPDVEVMRRYLEREVAGARIDVADKIDQYLARGQSPEVIAEGLAGAKVAGTYRHGKYTFVELAGRPWLMLHFGMTGNLRVTDRAEDFPVAARVSLRLADGRTLHVVDPRRLGHIALIDDPAVFIAEKRLGPDALDPGFGETAFVGSLRRRRGPLKGLWLNQRFVAGVGNIYADEICLDAKVAPFSAVERLKDVDRGALYRSMRHVLERGIEIRESGGEFSDEWLLLQRRASGVCVRCGGPVARRKFQGRYTYWCPSCQRER